MNAVEEIQAAIDTLDTMRAVSDSGAWTVAGIHPDCSIEGDVNFIAGDMYDYDAALIVTLHRTIDAQLAILHAAKVDEYEWAEEWGRIGKPHLRGPAKIVPINRAALELARAINGTV